MACFPEITGLSLSGIQIVAQVGSLVGTVIVVARVAMNYMESQSPKRQQAEKDDTLSRDESSSRMSQLQLQHSVEGDSSLADGATTPASSSTRSSKKGSSSNTASGAAGGKKKKKEKSKTSNSREGSSAEVEMQEAEQV